MASLPDPGSPAVETGTSVSAERFQGLEQQVSSLATMARSLQDAIGSLVPAVEALTTRVNTPPPVYDALESGPPAPMVPSPDGLQLPIPPSGSPRDRNVDPLQVQDPWQNFRRNVQDTPFNNPDPANVNLPPPGMQQSPTALRDAVEVYKGKEDLNPFRRSEKWICLLYTSPSPRDA